MSSWVTENRGGDAQCLAAAEILVEGTVQGVGYRPFVYRTAVRLDIAGWVRNTAAGVRVKAQGRPESLREFVAALSAEAPRLAVVRRVGQTPCVPEAGLSGFAIVESALGDSPGVDITRDTAVCDACLAEMRDPSNRRYRHPFINCTDCGPRYTIITALPYDRPNTSMAGFAMCPDCAAEYHDPANRRFHAQPVCCNECGPRLSALDSNGAEVGCDDPLRWAVEQLAAGSIGAVKGLGGFHLACRADSEEAVAELRRRKAREQKPFAVMVRNLSVAERWCDVSTADGSLLRSVERPIVLMPRRGGAVGLASAVAPGVATIGVMLPYTPLHYLLMDTDLYDTLVMTSGNLSDEPICADEREAVRRLADIADFFLVHNRPISMRLDDSVVRSHPTGPVIVRRARGYVPESLAVEHDVTGVVGLGGILKSTVCVGRGRSCYVSQYLGTAATAETVEHCGRTLEHLVALLGVSPVLYVRDLHPAALTPAIVSGSSVPFETVQHHHAHAAACKAENGLRGPCLAVVYDGVGLGDDGTVWGGEILRLDGAGCERLASLSPMPMPGGDAATQSPGRMALAALYEVLGERVWGVCGWLPEEARDAVVAVLMSGVNCPQTSSMGRLFDAAAGLLDVCRRRTYEGQPAMELEGVASPAVTDAYPYQIISENGLTVMKGAQLLARLVEDRDRGTPVAVLAARFQNTVADMTVAAVRKVAAACGLIDVCLSGGCFHNTVLLARVISGLEAAGLQPWRHRVLSPGDECISFGQVVIAGLRRELLPGKCAAESATSAGGYLDKRQKQEISPRRTQRTDNEADDKV